MNAIDWSPIYDKYKGLWVALKNDEETVIGSGENIKDAVQKAKDNGYDNPILFHVPDQLTYFA